MFESEIAVNEFVLGKFTETIRDIPEESLFVPSPGHGHPPIWILGHLAITGEMGLKFLGGSVAHMEWVALFGPGSSDKIVPTQGLNKAMMSSTIIETYRRLRELAVTAKDEMLSHPHGVSLLDGTSIKTAKQLVSLLLTSHFGFHLAQLSSCRRVAGHEALF